MCVWSSVIPSFVVTRTRNAPGAALALGASIARRAMKKLAASASLRVKGPPGIGFATSLSRMTEITDHFMKDMLGRSREYTLVLLSASAELGGGCGDEAVLEHRPREFA